MKILVTGSGGFLGKVLVKKLADNGYNVVAVTRTPLETDNIGSKVENIVADLSSEIGLSSLPSDIDGLIHLAQSRYYKDFPNRYQDIVDVNVLAGVRLLEYARQSGIKNISIASTGSVYAPSVNAISENECPMPTDFYGASKYALEVLAKPYDKFFNLSVFRIFRLYGPGQSNSLIPSLFKRIKEGQPIILNGEEGIEIVSTHIDDASDIFIKAITESWIGVYNMASPHHISLEKLCMYIGMHVGKEPIFKHIDQVKNVIPNTQKLSNKFNTSNMKNIIDEIHLMAGL